MDYEELRRCHRAERDSPKLSSVEPSFYSDLCGLINDFKKQAKESSASDDAKVLENVLKISRDVFDRREQKIFLKALRFAKTGELDANSMTPGEKAFFDSVVCALNQSRAEFENVLLGKKKQVEKTEITQVQNMNDIPAINGIDKPAACIPDAVLVRIVKKVPKFVSGDMKEYGPFEIGDVHKIPKNEADLLLQKSFAELV